MDNYNQPQPRYQFGGLMFVNNPQYVYDYIVAPNVMMIFMDEAAKKLYKKYGVPYGQSPIEEYDMTLVPSRQQQEATALDRLMNEISAMRADIDALKGGGPNGQPDA